MWYDLRNMRMLFFLGAAMAFVGLGLIMMDRSLPGLIVLIAGMAVLLIAFTAIKLHAQVRLRRR